MGTIPPTVFPTDWTAADMLMRLGEIPLQRIRMVPPPGMATEKDVLEVESRGEQICELIDGVLVEKTMGYLESLVAGTVVRFLGRFVETHDLGIVLGADGTLRILPNQVRIPDVSFIRWARFRNRELPREPIPAVVPNLAVEVLSEANTEGEMKRKLHDYFTAGVRLVWYIDLRTRTVRACTAEEQCVELKEPESLSGSEVLPGFELSLCDLFAKIPRKHSSNP